MKLTVIAILGLLVCGCSKGEKGDPGTNGSSGVLGSAVYSGLPTTNPQFINCPALTDLSKQMLSVYAVSDSLQFPLPYTSSDHHLYTTGYKAVSIQTIYSGGTHAQVALRTSTGIQYTYRIVVITFASAQARAAYIKSCSPANGALGKLVYGAD